MKTLHIFFLLCLQSIIFLHVSAQGEIQVITVNDGKVPLNLMNKTNCIGLYLGPIGDKINRIKPSKTQLFYFDLKRDIATYFHKIDLQMIPIVMVTDFELDISKINDKIEKIGAGYLIQVRESNKESTFVYQCKVKSGACSVQDLYDKYAEPLAVIVQEMDKQIAENEKKKSNGEKKSTLNSDELVKKADSLTNNVNALSKKVDSLISHFNNLSFIEISYMNSFSNNLNLSGDNYDLEKSNEIGIHYLRQISNADKTNFRMFAGVGFTHRSFLIHSNLTNSDYSIKLTDNSSGLDYKVVLYQGVEEKMSAQYNTISIPIEYQMKLSNKFLFSNSLSLNYAFPFTVTSELTSGSFNYRGRKNEISQDIVNISSLDLLEDVSYTNFSQSVSKLTGFGINLNFALMYTTKYFYLKGGPCLSYFSFSNYSRTDNYFLSSSIKNYNSTFNNLSSIKTPTLGFQFSFGIKIS